MAVSVRIEDEAFSDARVDLLATLCGYNRYEALGRLAHLWRACTQLNKYTLKEELVEAIVGQNGAENLVQCELAQRNKNGIRVRGAKGRIEWLEKLRKNGKKGGRPKKTKTKANGLVNGLHLDTEISKQLNPPAPAPAPAPVTTTASKNHTTCTEPEKPLARVPKKAPPPAPGVGIKIPLADGTDFDPPQADAQEWQEAFPGVDILQALRSMRQWCLSNPGKRKTKRGVRRFITSWLDREQNSRGRNQPAHNNYKQQRSAFVEGSLRALEWAHEQDEQERIHGANDQASPEILTADSRRR